MDRCDNATADMVTIRLTMPDGREVKRPALILGKTDDGRLKLEWIEGGTITVKNLPPTVVCRRGGYKAKDRKGELS